MKNKDDTAPLCKCGCGQHVKRSKATGKWNRFVLGHNNKKTAYEKSESKNRPHRFHKKNKFGKGRPKGSKNKCTIAAENIFEEESGAIARQAVDMALNGHPQMIKLIMERTVSIKKSSAIKLDGMPKIDSVESAGKAAEFILQSIATGRVSPLEGEILSRVLDKRLHSLQITEIEQELKMIKEKIIE
ncbi:MAG: hypothetical protein HUN04_22295 [Desulfobacter sp.]|nr:MAG: hypothetical protein HUN04_22295 [Desulfobacter sp.]